MRAIHWGTVDAMEHIAIVGAGGFGREIVTVLDHDDSRDDRPTIRFFDDGRPDVDRLERLGLALEGTVDDLAARTDLRYLIGIGTGTVRQRIDVALRRAGLSATNAVHRHSTIGRDVEMGDGHVLCAGSVLTTNIRAGRHLHMNICAAIGHDCSIGDYVTVSPAVTISGGVTVGDRAFLGTNSVVLPGLQLGSDCTIGSGAVVTKDVAPGETVVGVPARPISR